MNEIPQAIAPAVEDRRGPADAADRALEFRGPFLTSREAAAYLRRPTLNALYEWCRRRHLSPRASGLYVKAEIDRALRHGRKRHAMAAASLSNLRRRRKA